LAFLTVIALMAGNVAAEVQKTLPPLWERFSFTIKNRKVDGARQRIPVLQGDVVQLVFKSDEAVELYLHGYDEVLNLEPNVATAMFFQANIAGRFPIEAHGFGSTGSREGRHVVLLYLDAYPRGDRSRPIDPDRWPVRPPP
jgi:hypothetical protein